MRSPRLTAWLLAALIGSTACSGGTSTNGSAGSTADSHVALDRSTGTIVWRTKAPGGINGSMSVAGDTIVVPVGNMTPPSLVAYRAP